MATIMIAEKTSSAHRKTDSTSLANRSAAPSPPSPCSARLYIGTKATEKAPSANRRRKVLGRMKASWNASARSEEHTSELQSLMRISYAVFCLKKKNNKKYT